MEKCTLIYKKTTGKLKNLLGIPTKKQENMKIEDKHIKKEENEMKTYIIQSQIT